MEYLSWIPEYLVPFLIIITILVFVHEMGHYLIAKRYGVKVEVFSIGFGRELFGWNDKSGTRWKFSLIPMGGYVKMFGDGLGKLIIGNADHIIRALHHGCITPGNIGDIAHLSAVQLDKVTDTHFLG